MFTEKKHGFTMVETIVAISISLVIMILVNNTFFQNVKTVKADDKINTAEFQKFLVWKSISTSILKMQCRYTLLKDGYYVTNKAKITLSGKKGKGFDKMELMSWSFPDGAESTLVFTIGDKEISRGRDGKEHALSKDFHDGAFSFKKNAVNLAGVIKIETEIGKNDYEIPVDLLFHIDRRNIDVVLK